MKAIMRPFWGDNDWTIRERLGEGRADMLRDGLRHSLIVVTMWTVTMARWDK